MPTVRRLAAAASSMLLVASAALLSPAPAAAAKIKMVFTGSPTTLSLPFFVAQKKGWLGDLEVDEVYVTGDSNAMRVLLSGNADIATIGTLNVLASIERGAAVRAIGSWQPIGDYNLILAKGKGTTLADLAGKVFAASGPGALPEQLARLTMEKHGVDASKTRFLQVGGHAARVQAVLSGRADATLANTVTTFKALDKVTILTKISQEFPHLGYVWNVVRQDAMNDPARAAAFQTLTDAGIRGSRFIMEHPEEAAAIMHDKVPDLAVDYLTATIRDLNGEKLWGTNGGLDPQVAEFTIKINMQFGEIKQPLQAAQVLDPRYVDDALKRLGRQ